MDKKIACEKLPPGWEKHEGSSNDLNLISNLTLRYFKITVDSTFGTLSLAPSRENCQTGRKSQRLQCCPLVLKWCSLAIVPTICFRWLSTRFIIITMRIPIQLLIAPTRQWLSPRSPGRPAAQLWILRARRDTKRIWSTSKFITLLKLQINIKFWTFRRRSYPLKADSDKPIRFAVRSLGWVEIAEEDLTPERSSKAVNKCILDLSFGKNDLLDVVGRWGDVSPCQIIMLLEI